MAKVDYKDIAKVVCIEVDDANTPNFASQLAAYLVEERRVSDLGRIMREVERLRLVNRDLVEADVHSAYELTAELEQKIETILKAEFQATNVILNNTVDKNLVGGVKIQAQDTLIDLSVRGQLNKLKAHNF